MAAIGLGYLSFEDFVLNDFSRTEKKQIVRSTRHVGRVLIGIQVSFTHQNNRFVRTKPP
jgi:hypothetical protein